MFFIFYYILYLFHRKDITVSMNYFLFYPLLIGFKKFGADIQPPPPPLFSPHAYLSGASAFIYVYVPEHFYICENYRAFVFFLTCKLCQ
jgi:hypothetical protein